MFFFLALIVFGLAKTALFTRVEGFFEEKLLVPLEKTFFNLGLSLSSTKNDRIQELENEKKILLAKLAAKESLALEISALRDQFQTALPKSQHLLPAQIVGAPRFIPGVTLPEKFIIDRGEKDGVRVGQGVVFKDNLVGRVVRVSLNLSQVDIVFNASSSFTATTTRTGALGVLRGRGNGEMILDNILLSEDLKASDMVVTRGDLDRQGVGLPKGIIVGTIVSLDKKPSALFQTAKVKSLLDFSKLSTIFVVIGEK